MTLTCWFPLRIPGKLSEMTIWTTTWIDCNIHSMVHVEVGIRGVGQ